MTFCLGIPSRLLYLLISGSQLFLCSSCMGMWPSPSQWEIKGSLLGDSGKDFPPNERERHVRETPHLSLLAFECCHVRTEAWSCSKHHKTLWGRPRDQVVAQSPMLWNQRTNPGNCSLLHSLVCEKNEASYLSHLYTCLGWNMLSAAVIYKRKEGSLWKSLSFPAIPHQTEKSSHSGEF